MHCTGIRGDRKNPAWFDNIFDGLTLEFKGLTFSNQKDMAALWPKYIVLANYWPSNPDTEQCVVVCAKRVCFIVVTSIVTETDESSVSVKRRDKFIEQKTQPANPSV